MILEELEQADTVTLDHVFNLDHECSKALLVARVVDELGSISALGASGGAVNLELENVAVLQEIVITNLNWLVGLAASINFCNAGDFMGVHGETVCSHNLTEDLGGNLEVLVIVMVLEEALGVKSVAAHDFLEANNHIVNTLTFRFGSVFAPIFSFLVSVTQRDVDILFKVLLGEDCIDLVDEFSPANMVASFLLTSREGIAKHFEFGI